MKAKLVFLIILIIPEFFHTNVKGIEYSFNKKKDLIETSDTLVAYFKPVIPIFDSSATFHKIDAYYGLQFYKNGILYMNNTKRNLGTLSDYVSFGKLDTYFVPLKNFRLGIPEYFTKRVPFPYPPGAISFTKDYKVLYFTKPVSGPSGSLRYVIFEIKKDPLIDEWLINNAKPLPFCEDNHSYMHPAISSDGKTLIFSSNMSSKPGGSDLFQSTKGKAGWSKPVNLGPLINSDKNEFFPFLDNHNNLYFSSNRRIKSGYDIYFSHFTDKGWQRPIQLGKEINTDTDEMIFKLDHDNSLALLISFNDSGVARTHFYITSFPENLKSSPKHKTVVLTKRKSKPLKQSKISTIKQAKEHKKITSPAPVQSPPNKKVERVIFRVQIISLMKPRKDFTVSVNNKKYLTWHYYYKGAYRYTVGNFKNVSDALRFKNLCTKHGHPQAFVAAFKGKKRITDPKVFRH